MSPAALHADSHSFSSSGVSFVPLFFFATMLFRASSPWYVAATKVDRQLGHFTTSGRVSTSLILSHFAQCIHTKRNFVRSNLLRTRSIIDASSTAGRNSPCGTMRSNRGTASGVHCPLSCTASIASSPDATSPRNRLAPSKSSFSAKSSLPVLAVLLVGG